MRNSETFPQPGIGAGIIPSACAFLSFTCLCPRTGQPDFATLHLEYVPDALCVELKSLKNYIWSFRDKGALHEAVTNSILSDLAHLLSLRFMRLTAEFNVRGGIFTTVVQSTGSALEPAANRCACRSAAC